MWVDNLQHKRDLCHHPLLMWLCQLAQHHREKNHKKYTLTKMVAIGRFFFFAILIIQDCCNAIRWVPSLRVLVYHYTRCLQSNFQKKTLFQFSLILQNILICSMGHFFTMVKASFTKYKLNKEQSISGPSYMAPPVQSHLGCNNTFWKYLLAPQSSSSKFKF